MRITRAYEVLKDEELRKKYDQHGEEGLSQDKNQGRYESWQWYQQNFGIYDDDQEIITLSKSDFGKPFLRDIDYNDKIIDWRIAGLSGTVPYRLQLNQKFNAIKLAWVTTISVCACLAFNTHCQSTLS